jgi:hypothetical protein
MTVISPFRGVGGVLSAGAAGPGGRVITATGEYVIEDLNNRGWTCLIDSRELKK